MSCRVGNEAMPTPVLQRYEKMRKYKRKACFSFYFRMEVSSAAGQRHE